MIRWMFTAVSILCCGILIPINIYYNTKVAKNTDQNILLTLTIRDVQGSWLWAHVAMTYIITLVIFAFIYMHWNAMVRMRGIWFRSSEYMDSFYARTLMVQGVPKKFQSDEGIRAIFQSMQMPYPTTSVHIGRRVGDLPEKIEKHNDTVRELEQVLVAYLKNGNVGKKRPTIRLGGGCGGEKVDAIDYYTYVTTRTHTHHRLLTLGSRHRLGRGSRPPRELSRITAVRSTIANPRITVLLLWPPSLTPTLSLTCSRVRSLRGPKLPWRPIPRTLSVDHLFLITPYPVDISPEDLEQFEYECQRASRKKDYGLGVSRPRRIL